MKSTWMIPRLVLPCLAALALGLQEISARLPNVIVIMADDMGYGDVGYNPAAPDDVVTPTWTGWRRTARSSPPVMLWLRFVGPPGQAS